LECLDFDGQTAKLLVHCSKGTYIRTLCKDIGMALGCGGCMEQLRRVSAGAYDIAQAVSMEEIVNSSQPQQYLMPVDSLFSQHPAMKLTTKQETRCRNGNSFSIDLPDGTYRAYTETGEFLMLARVEKGVMSTIKSFFEV
jgi:tRNA pseudouridine55 synthase